MNIKQGLCLLALMSASAVASADLVVVANPGVHFNSLPQAQVTRLFLGQTNNFPDGSAAQPLDINNAGQRNTFYENVLKRSPEQIEKYWARMIFTGKAQPPRQVRANEIKALVAEIPGAISYIDSSQVDASVKVITVTP